MACWNEEDAYVRELSTKNFYKKAGVAQFDDTEEPSASTPQIQYHLIHQYKPFTTLLHQL
jgi:hypothetical protein